MEFITKENKLLGEKYLFAKHKSGLEVFIIPKDQDKSFAIFGTRYGAMDRTFKTADDDDYVTVPDGIAHFLEHKMFENEDGSDTFAKYAAFGASANAFTSNELTAYLFSATDHYYENLEILLDFVTHPYFTDETVQKEQGIIGQEIRMYDDSPFWSMYQNLIKGLYVKSNVRIDVAGTVESIAEITPEILYRCHSTFYNLNNMSLVLCGKFEPAEVERVCDKVLKKAPEIELLKKDPAEPTEICEAVTETSFPIAVPMFLIGLKDNDIDLTDPGEKLLMRKAENEIILDMLFGMSGDFYNDLYESGLLSDKFDVDYQLARNYSFGALQGESREPMKIFEKARELVDAVRSGKSDALSPEAFERSRKVIYAKAVSEWSSTTGIAEGFLDARFVGCDLIDYAETVSRVTFDDVKKRLDEFYSSELMAISIVNPAEEK